MSDLVKILNQQLIELDRLNGASVLAADVIKALDTTIAEYYGDRSKDNILQELLKLYHVFLDCRPRMPHIISDLQSLILCLHQNKEAQADDLRRLIASILEDDEVLLKNMVSFVPGFFSNVKAVLLHSLSLPIERSFELLSQDPATSPHSPPNKVPPSSRAILPNLPTVFVADQEASKSARIIKLFNRLQIPFDVVSEFAVCHIASQLDCAIFGGLTLTPKNEVILAPGSTSLISQLKMANIPVYLFLGTNKFSFWNQSTPLAFQETRNKNQGHIQYKKEVFSHDVVQAELFTQILTETGFLTPTELKDLFLKKQVEFYEHEKIISSIVHH